jgi:hypothetical protein
LPHKYLIHTRDCKNDIRQIPLLRLVEIMKQHLEILNLESVRGEGVLVEILHCEVGGLLEAEVGVLLQVCDVGVGVVADVWVLLFFFFPVPILILIDISPIIVITLLLLTVIFLRLLLHFRHFILIEHFQAFPSAFQHHNQPPILRHLLLHHIPNGCLPYDIGKDAFILKVGIINQVGVAHQLGAVFVPEAEETITGDGEEVTYRANIYVPHWHLELISPRFFPSKGGKYKYSTLRHQH